MASSPQHEPTMEEILASIRKIISEDSNEPPKTEAAPAPPQEAEVLELTQEVEEEPAPAPRMEEPPPPPPKPEAPAALPQQDVVFQPVQQEAAMSMSAAQAPSNEIFSDKSRKALDDAFDRIDQAADTPQEAPQPRAQPNFSPAAAPDGDSVEAVFERAVANAVGPHIEQWMDGRKDEILTSMRPLIREWMDEHFPALLENVVREEVSRAMKARGRR